MTDLNVVKAVQEGLVVLENVEGNPMVSSIMLAEAFGRSHSHVMRSIDGILESDEIVVSTYKAERREEKCYYLNEEASLLAMPYIGGEKAKLGQRALVTAYMNLRDNAPSLPQFNNALASLDTARMDKIEDGKNFRAGIKELKNKASELRAQVKYLKASRESILSGLDSVHPKLSAHFRKTKL